MSEAAAPTALETWRGVRVLITGHTGFKGSWATLWLDRLGARVGGISLADPVSDPCLFDLAELSKRCYDRRCDIADIDALRSAVTALDPEFIFHFAAQPIVRRGYASPRETWQTNVIGTANLLEVIRDKRNIRGVIVATSDKCYRNDGTGRAFTEDDPLGGSDPYSASKAAQEMVVAGYRALDDLPPIVTVRAGNVIGGGDWGEDRLVPDISRAFAEARQPEIRQPNATRPWQHVLDCLNGYLELGARMLDTNALADSYNFGPDKNDSLTVYDVATRFASTWGDKTWHDASTEQSGAPKEATSLRLDNTRARQDLGWSPRLNAGQSVDMAATWYRNFAQNGGAHVLCCNDLESFANATGSDQD